MSRYAALYKCPLSLSLFIYYITRRNAHDTLLNLNGPTTSIIGLTNTLEVIGQSSSWWTYHRLTGVSKGSTPAPGINRTGVIHTLVNGWQNRIHNENNVIVISLKILILQSFQGPKFLVTPQLKSWRGTGRKEQILFLPAWERAPYLPFLGSLTFSLFCVCL